MHFAICETVLEEESLRILKVFQQIWLPFATLVLSEQRGAVAAGASPLLLWEREQWGATEVSSDGICCMTCKMRSLGGTALSSLEEFALLLFQCCSENKLPGNEAAFGAVG